MDQAATIGDLVDTAIVAHAIEPAAGGPPDNSGHTHEGACLNCGTALVGSHCHACGQAAHVHRTLGAFFHDLAHGVFHFEGKIWRTLPQLVLHPGRMTREYVDGRRAAYVSPIALFLFCVFLLFSVVSHMGNTLGDIGSVSTNGKAISGIAANEQEIARLQQLRAALAAQGKPTAAIDGEITGRQSGLDALKNARGEAIRKAVLDQKSGARSDLPAIQHAIDAFRANPQLGLYKLQSNAYKYAWALIPISVPMVWLLFPFSRRFGLYDHTVFVTYSLCFMALLVVVLSIAGKLGLPIVGIAAVVLPPLHMYRQLKGAYGLSRASALWRTAAMLFFSLFALIVFAMFVLAEAGQ
ncbi:DUF3667 domain-containing protein [Novosphingobium lentum]|uniref:DUF3667 domain-containing protein n=1 Tax=Novosphingobium lentum TaxID=145287 RepID=UPI000829AF27|nr:DUF3667 domain-containing protein [Novosphingobium lentum]